MVSSLRQCPGVEGKVCNRFLPSKENIPIICVCPVVVSPASVTIGVRNATTGLMITAVGKVITCTNFRCSSIYIHIYIYIYGIFILKIISKYLPVG